MKTTSRKPLLIVLAAALMMTLGSCADRNVTRHESENTAYRDAMVIKLSGDLAEIDGEKIGEFDYTWHCDPGVSHDEMDKAPAEYYTGTKPDTDAVAYIDHELYYFPELPESGFKLVNYDGENEWAYYYTDGVHDDYIFATLPNLGNKLPSDMMHSEAQAAENKVLHITKAGTYVLEGTWQGQIWVDLGNKDETFSDEDAKVPVVLNGVEVNCSAAPAIVFYSAYECDNTWEDRDAWSENVGTENAGVNVIIADGTENTFTGTNVSRMLKTKYKDDDSTDAVKVQKKMRKTDAAFYSYVTMNIDGEAEGTGTLTVNSGFEGLDSELHLSFNGGNIEINSQDDGINVNEDDVSVVSFNGAYVRIKAGQGAEGDGVDSNGFVVINGGTVSIDGITPPDSAIDSECGIYYHFGTVKIDGEEQTYNSGDVFRETGTMGGPGEIGKPGQMPGDMGDRPMDFQPSDFDIKDFKKKVAELDDDATLDDVLAILGIDRGQGGEQMPNGMFGGGDFQPPDKPN